MAKKSKWINRGQELHEIRNEMMAEVNNPESSSSKSTSSSKSGSLKSVKKSKTKKPKSRAVKKVKEKKEKWVPKGLQTYEGEQPPFTNYTTDQWQWHIMDDDIQPILKVHKHFAYLSQGCLIAERAVINKICAATGRDEDDVKPKKVKGIVRDYVQLVSDWVLSHERNQWGQTEIPTADGRISVNDLDLIVYVRKSSASSAGNGSGDVYGCENWDRLDKNKMVFRLSHNGPDIHGVNSFVDDVSNKITKFLKSEYGISGTAMQDDLEVAFEIARLDPDWHGNWWGK